MSVILGEMIMKPIVTSWESTVDSYIQNILSNRNNVWRVIGLDIERTFVRGKYHPYCDTDASKLRSRVAILKLCDGLTCLIIQLPYLSSIPKSLLNFLQRPDFTFVGIGIKETVAKLEREYGLGCKNAVELGQLAAGVMQKPNLSACGVDVLADVVELQPLRVEESASVVFSDWGDEVLNKKQISFAAATVFAYFKIGNKLVSGQISN